MIYDIAVVGGGIVGLATVRELKLRYPDLKVANVEKESGLNRHQSGRNSGVIHSGIYYKPGSLKAKLCIEGRKLAWQYCDEKSIPYKQVGKLIVATEESELGRLDDLMERGRTNGVEDLEMLNAEQIREREPHARGIRAISSPTTGIVDWARVANSYAEDARAQGADFFLEHEVTNISRRASLTVLHTTSGEVQAKYAITCAGVFSDKVAQMTGGSRDPQIIPFRGDYMVLKPEKSDLVRGNIYPVPDPAFPFLGVHFTPRMDGSVWLGPNAVLAFAREGYKFWNVNLSELWESVTYPGFKKLASEYWQLGTEEMRRDLIRSEYVKALQRYIPELRVEDCEPGPSGIRAQAMAPDGTLVDDFVFEGGEGIMHVRNAPSPGATSSLAIGKYIVDDAEKRFNLGKPVEPAAKHASDAKSELHPSASVDFDPPFVDVDWLMRRLLHPRVRIVDTRSIPHGAPSQKSPSGEDQYAAGHILGAIHLDYADDLQDPATPYAARVAPPERFAEVMAAHGIGDGMTVVAYDDGTAPYAARLVWMLRYYGHDAVCILAGGFPAWKAAHGAVTKRTPEYPPMRFTSRVRPELRAQRDEVLALAEGRSDVQLLETQRDTTYALRDRDIKGAKRLSGSELLEDAHGGRIASAERLASLVDELGLDRHKRTIVSCGSGVSAAGSYLALRAAGFTDVAVYDGSWMEWSHDNLPTVPKESNAK
jgi:L-2-hydroxyglutarate oxidase LhgO/3-mercaptopyruvate sulfurtransferase SseA